jgi:antitoxin MazE
MLVQIVKWGNSLAVRIPAAHAKELGLAENAKAELSVQNGRLVLTPLDEVPSFDLDALVAQITDENRHAEIETGPVVGEEFG